MKDGWVNLVALGHGLARLEGDVRTGGGELVLLDLPYGDASDLLRAEGSLALAATAPARDRLPLDELAGALPPLSCPIALWGVGLNYGAKAVLTGRSVPSDPILYIKPATAVAAPGAEIPIPALGSTQVDYEGEVAVVVGRRMDHVDEREAWRHVAGITAANDLTARDVMVATGNPTLAKSFRGFSPLGTSIRSLDDLDDPDDIGVRTTVNGELRQDGRTTDLIFAVPDLLARLSRYTTLEPGDVVLTGTPPGTGQDIDTYLGPGDRITVEVDGVVPLTNVIVPARPTRPGAGEGARTDARALADPKAAAMEANSHVPARR